MLTHRDNSFITLAEMEMNERKRRKKKFKYSLWFSFSLFFKKKGTHMKKMNFFFCWFSSFHFSLFFLRIINLKRAFLAVLYSFLRICVWRKKRISRRRRWNGRKKLRFDFFSFFFTSYEFHEWLACCLRGKMKYCRYHTWLYL